LLYLGSVFLKTNKMLSLKYNKTDHKTSFISSANSYMFRHHGAIIREFISNKGSWVQHMILGLVRVLDMNRVL
jgi:hypothetical protein